jgi:hypothetical protein
MSKRYSNMDDFFRDRFRNFEPEPPDYIWENIWRKISGNGPDHPGRHFKKGGIAGITTILILVGFITIYQFTNNAKNTQVTGITENEVIAFNDISGESSNHTVVESPANPVFSSPVKPNKKEIKKANSSSLVLGMEKAIPEGIVGLSNNLSDEISNLTADNSVVTAEEGNTGNAKFETVLSDLINPINKGITLNSNSGLVVPGTIGRRLGEGTQFLADAGDRSRLRDDYGKPGSWLLGLYFTPEMLYNPSVRNLNTRNYSLDVNAVYRYSGYLVQSGLGLMWSSDNGNCTVDYNQYLGSYEDVYNITFDTVDGEVVPTYYTETVKVYDTLTHVTISPAKNKYTYLNIPLLFGYGGEGRHFGWFFKAGPSLSVLVNKNVSEINEANNPNRIINIETEVPSRIETNLQLMMSGGMSLRLGKNLSFSIEPVFRYYVKSTYRPNGNNSRNPYSLGLRAGLLVNF